jgi:hypothetical protein
MEEPSPFGTRPCLGFPKNDLSLAQVIRKDLNFDSVPWNNSDKVFPHFPADMCENFLSIRQVHAKHRVGKCLGTTPWVSRGSSLGIYFCTLTSKGEIFGRELPYIKFSKTRSCD